MRAHRRQREQIVEAEHAERGGPFEQRVQHLGGGRRVGVRTVHRLHRRAEVAGQRAEPQVRHLVADEAARERNRVDAAVRQPRVAVRDERGVEEAGVEADVVADDHRVVRELEERGQHLADARRRQQHRFGDAGEHRDHRRDRDARIHERLEAPEQLAAAHPQRADLGDRVARAGDVPVVSRSTTTKVTSASGVPRSSSVCWRGGLGGAVGAGAKPDNTGANGEVGATTARIANVCSWRKYVRCVRTFAPFGTPDYDSRVCRRDTGVAHVGT